jgi:leader peptidase (prepilin peptidase) / N-methyltransferase
METILHILGGILLIFVLKDDLKDKQIRILPVVFIGVLGFFIRCVLNCDVMDGLLGTVIGMLLLLIGKITRQSIGYGDGLVFISIGMLIGIKQVTMVLFASLLLAFIYSIVLLIFKKVRRKTSFPFVPFIFLSYLGIHFL